MAIYGSWHPGTLISKSFLFSAQSTNVLCSLWNFVCEQLEGDAGQGLAISFDVKVDGGVVHNFSRRRLQDLLFLLKCVCGCARMHMCHVSCVRGQLAGLSSPLQLCGFWGSTQVVRFGAFAHRAIMLAWLILFLISQTSRDARGG